MSAPSSSEIPAKHKTNHDHELKNDLKKLHCLLAICYLSLASHPSHAQSWIPLQFRTTDNALTSSNALASNLLAGAGVTITKGALGRLTFSIPATLTNWAAIDPNTFSTSRFTNLVNNPNVATNITVVGAATASSNAGTWTITITAPTETAASNMAYLVASSLTASKMSYSDGTTISNSFTAADAVIAAIANAKLDTNNGTGFNLTNRSTFTSQAIAGQTNDQLVLRHTNGNPAMIVNSNATTVNWFNEDGTHRKGETNTGGMSYHSVSNRLWLTVNGGNAVATISGPIKMGATSTTESFLDLVSFAGVSGVTLVSNASGAFIVARNDRSVGLFCNSIADGGEIRNAAGQQSLDLLTLRAAGRIVTAQGVNLGGAARFGAHAVSNINGTTSTSLSSNTVTLLTNVSTYTFNSGTGTNQTVTLPDTGTVFDGQIWQLAHGSQGTNYLTLLTAKATNAIGGLTNGFIVTPGWTGSLQKQGSNYNFIAGTPGENIGDVTSKFVHLAGTGTALDSWHVWCEGQVLSDAASPLNGVTIPDLNGQGGTQRFLRGGITTGVTGGADTHTHAGTVATTESVDNAQFGADFFAANAAHQHTFTTDPGSSLPSYNTVRYKIRVK
jgi:hypothetical protein